MTFKIKLNQEINIQDIDDIFESFGWHKRTSEKWQKLIERSSFCVQVLNNEKTIGFGRVLDDGDYCMIYDVVVHPDFQKQGVGYMVMNEIMNYINQNNFTTVRLFYWKENTNLPRFYEKFGFQKMPNGMGL